MLVKASYFCLKFFIICFLTDAESFLYQYTHCGYLIILMEEVLHSIYNHFYVSLS